jgi:hypothetical protein
MTRDKGISRASFSKHCAINGAENQSITYMAAATMMLNHSTLE